MNIVKDSRYGPFIFPNKDKYIGKSFDLYGEFSYHEVSFLKSLIEPGNVVIDCGANIGGITIPLAQKIGAGGYMVAFEPQQYIYHILCGNVAINNLTNTAVFQRLASNVDGEVRGMPVLNYEAEGNFGDNSTDKVQEDMLCIPVATCTIDNLNLSALHLIKIDVQGEELDVLNGASESIKRTRPFLYVEAESKEESEKVIEFLERHDYSYFFHRPTLFNRNNFYGNEIDVFDGVDEYGVVNFIVSGNIFAYPKEKKEWDETINKDFFVRTYEEGGL
jgi:FkbM family methyltransferase